jgi:hypothetical protein
MKTQAVNLFVFSFICFIGVLIFGSIIGPLKKSMADEVFRNISLFHSHFDQLCWLGSAALGGAFWVLASKFTGADRVIRIFVFSYALGTLLFSMGFLFRAIGLHYNSRMIKMSADIGMISFGGLLIAVTAICALYIAINLFSWKKTDDGHGRQVGR